MDWLHVSASSLNFLYTRFARDLYFEIRELTDRAANATELEYACMVVTVSDGGLFAGFLAGTQTTTHIFIYAPSSILLPQNTCLAPERNCLSSQTNE